MEEEKKEKTKTVNKVNEEVDKTINRIIEQGVQTNNIDFLYKMIDIKKDIAEIEKEENEMMYNAGNYGRNYYNEGTMGNYVRGSYNEGNYGARGRERDSQGRFTGGRGSGRYRGEQMIDDMSYHYGNYSEGREQYGTDEDTMKSFKYMLKSFKDYYKHLKQEASTQQEVQMLEETAREMLEM